MKKGEAACDDQIKAMNDEMATIKLLVQDIQELATEK
jgi:hypothetical protein